MKFTVLSLVLLCLLARQISAQESIVVDEFQNPNCEDLWARLDNFIIQIQNNSTSLAIIEMSAKRNDIRNNLYWEEMIRGYFRQRNIPADRLSILRTAETDNRFFRLWLKPQRASPPDVKVAEWPMEYSPGSKPFVFTNGDSYAVEMGVCLYVNEIGLLARVMKFNSGARLNVVLIVRSDREFRRRKTKVLRELVDDHSVSVSRIRFFKKIRLKPNPYGIYPDAEYWLIP